VIIQEEMDESLIYIKALEDVPRSTSGYLKVLDPIRAIITALLKVDFGRRSQSRVHDFYTTFIKKSTLLDFKSGNSDLDSTPPRWSTPSPKP